MFKKFDFYARPGGDGECFCFFVNKDTFVSLMGEEAYKEEMECRKAWHKEVNGDADFEEPTEFPIYPNKFFPRGNCLKIHIAVDEVEEVING